MPLSDRELTTLQLDGRLRVFRIGAETATVADLVEACDTLGIDPHTVAIHGSIEIAGSSFHLRVMDKIPKDQTTRSPADP